MNVLDTPAFPSFACVEDCFEKCELLSLLSIVQDAVFIVFLVG